MVKIKVLHKKSYNREVTQIIANVVDKKISTIGRCNIMLTGGQTASDLYSYWARKQPWDHSKITYYFGDERCVSPDDQDSNYGMSIKTLFPNGIPVGCNIQRVKGETKNKVKEAKRYSELLPKSMDVLLLSVGPDGHIASLFPNTKAILSEEYAAIPVVGNKKPLERFTITPLVVKNADSLFLMAKGREKGRILSKSLLLRDENVSPVYMTVKGLWLLDEEAKNNMESNVVMNLL